MIFSHLEFCLNIYSSSSPAIGLRRMYFRAMKLQLMERVESLRQPFHLLCRLMISQMPVIVMIMTVKDYVIELDQDES